MLFQKIHKKACDIQDEKVRICREAYDKVDREVNEFDVKLQRYNENRERALKSPYAIERLAFLEGRKRKKKNRRQHNRVLCSLVSNPHISVSGPPPPRETASNEAAALAEYPADPSEPRYCFCQRVSFIFQSFSYVFIFRLHLVEW